MTLGDVLLTATRPIRTRSLESALIVVAVALGVGVVTAMLALILNGLEQERGLSESLYARELVLVSRDQDNRGFYEAGQINPVISIGNSTEKPFKFDVADLETVRKACPAIKYAYVTQYVGVAESGGSDDPSRRREVNLIGVSREYIEAAGLTLIAGSWPTGDDFKAQNRLILLSEWYARQRFEKQVYESKAPNKPNDAKKSIKLNAAKNGDAKAPKTTQATKKPFDVKDVVGKDINSFKIIGVFAVPKQNPEIASAVQPFGAKGISTFGERFDSAFSTSMLNDLKFQAQPDQLDIARDQLRTYATRRWGEGAAVRSSNSEIIASLSTARNAALITVLFASGGLVIAALNITNLMLARVLGRTRSIGISSALGASSQTIFGLFLTESLVLGLLGGLLGLLLARGITYGLEISLQRAGPNMGGMDLTLQPLHFVIGLLTSLFVSLLFGAYPAWMAARIRPSEALRG
jgi:ABC-type antimicrobial peptide transport system permease subunit